MKKRITGIRRRKAKPKHKHKDIPPGFVLDTVAIFIKDFPRQLRDEFKAYCARRGITMKDRIRELMQGDVARELEAMRHGNQPPRSAR